MVTTTQAEDTLPLPNRKPQPLPDPTRTGDRKIEHDMAMARLAAEIHLRSSRYAKRPSRKFVSASTQEYVWATYLRAWVDRAERVGNLNYPDEARRRKLSGTVVINIGIRVALNAAANGSSEGWEARRRSPASLALRREEFWSDIHT